MLSPVSRNNLSDQVFAQLRDQILVGERHPGERLPSERVLCDVLGVNRSSVREAIKRLEQARLVVTRHGGGSVVLDYREHASMDMLPHLVMPRGQLDPAALRSIIEFREMLMPMMAQLAAQRIDDEQRSRLEALVAQIDAVEDAAAMQDLDLEFHSIVAKASENLAFMLIFNSVRHAYRDYRSFFTAMFEPTEALRARYHKLLDALVKADPGEAEAASRELNLVAHDVFQRSV